MISTTGLIRFGSRAVLILLILCSVIRAQPPRPTTRGISLAYPQREWIKFPGDLLAGQTYDIRVPLTIGVDTEGTVTSVKLDRAFDSLLFPALDSAIRAIPFVAGTKNGAPARQTIFIDCWVTPGAKSARFYAPVSDSLIVRNAARYAEALYANGLATPTVARLAPYFCPLTSGDSVSHLPSILFKISISINGAPRTLDVVRSDYPAVTDQITAVLNWGKFDPGQSPARRASAEFYVAVAFHPAARYPTRRVGTVGKDTASLVEQLLIQIFPDTLGLMLLPLPRRLQHDSVSLAEAVGKQYGRISVWLVVDSSGKTQMERVSRRERPVLALISRALADISLYPALGFDGRPRPFRGLAYVEFDGSAIVRVRLDWLAERAADPIR